MDSFTLFLVLLAVFVAGYVFGMSRARGIYVMQQSKKTTIPVCIAEYQKGNYYLYDRDTNKFMCQAKTLEGLADELSRYKNITLAYVYVLGEGENKSFWIINGKVNPLSIYSYES